MKSGGTFIWLLFVFNMSEGGIEMYIILNNSLLIDNRYYLNRARVKFKIQ